MFTNPARANLLNIGPFNVILHSGYATMKQTSSFSSEEIAKYRRAFQQREQQRYHESEKQRHAARQIVCDAIAITMPHYPTVRRVYLFGSVTKPGAFRSDSDIDIGVEGVDVAVCFGIWRDLERIVKEWLLDVRSLDPDNPFSLRVRQQGELIYER